MEEKETNYDKNKMEDNEMFYIIYVLIGFLAMRGIMKAFKVLNDMSRTYEDRLNDGWEDVRSGEIVMRG